MDAVNVIRNVHVHYNLLGIGIKGDFEMDMCFSACTIFGMCFKVTVYPEYS